MNKEEIKIEPINNGFKASIEIPKDLIALELNEYLNKVDEINRLVINDKNELYIRELLNRINKAIEYIENEGEHTDCSGEPIYYLDEEQEEELLEILRGKE